MIAKRVVSLFLNHRVRRVSCCTVNLSEVVILLCVRLRARVVANRSLTNSKPPPRFVLLSCEIANRLNEVKLKKKNPNTHLPSVLKKQL